MKIRDAKSLNRAILWLANDLLVIVTVYITSLLVAALLFSLAEGRAYLDSLWWCVVTALTIGYGDIAPETAAGRVVAIVFQHFWIFGIAPLIIGNIIIRITQDHDQYTHAEQEWIQESIARIAAKLDVTLPEPASDTNFGDLTPATPGGGPVTGGPGPAQGPGPADGSALHETAPDGPGNEPPPDTTPPGRTS
ncbi:MAG: potassium channel family protein [Micromonosporaceae bacterium]